MKKFGFILLIVTLFLFGCDVTDENRSDPHGGKDYRSQLIEEHQYSYVMFTVKPPMLKDVTKKLLSYHVSHHAVDFALNTLCSILFSELSWNKTTTPDRGKIDGDVLLLGEIQYFKHFPIVAMLIRKNKQQVVSALLKAEFFFEVRPSMVKMYIGIIKTLDDVIERKDASFVNLSLQPTAPYPFNEKEAINVATRIAAERGNVIVIAAGNFGGLGNNTLSPWAVAPWVIGVGAAETNGAKLWRFSSRGIPNDPLYHPTVVAPGVDIEVEVEGFRIIISGTSIAVPAVLNIAIECWEFIKNLEASDDVAAWKRKATLDPGIHLNSLDPAPDLVIRMIKNMAVLMQSYGIHEVGAGFVDSDTAHRYFKNFAYKNFVDIFCDRRTASTTND